MRSTKQTDRTKALTEALEFERVAKKIVSGDIVETQARKVISDLMERLGNETIRNPSVKEFIDEWLESKEESRAAGTHVRYQKVCHEFIDMLGTRATKSVNSITARDIQRFISLRKKTGCSPTTLNLDGKILRTAFNHARRLGLIPNNPAEAVELPRAQSRERGVFSPEEVVRLLDAAKGEWKTMVMLGYYTGARLSDCCKFKWADVDFKNGVVSYDIKKTTERHLTPMHPELAEYLKKLIPASKRKGFVMPVMSKKGPGGQHGMSEGFKRIVKNAGIDLDIVEAQGSRRMSRKTFHSLRHSFISGLANAGVSEEIRMKLTGHKTKAVHKGYTHHELDVLKAAVNQHPGLKSGGSKTAGEHSSKSQTVSK